MKVIIAKDYEEMSKKAFEVMREVVKGNPRAVLGLRRLDADRAV